MFLRKLHPVLVASLIASHGVFLFAGFFAPYSYEAQNRSRIFAPPDRIHVRDPKHGYFLRPFIYRRVLRPGSLDQYDENRNVLVPIHFFVPGFSYRLCGLIVRRRHLFGVDGPTQIFLLGADDYGRDEFSRLLFGGRISLSVGFLACAISLSLALLSGGLAGYYGRWLDSFIMRAAELFLTVPWLYLLLSVRACLPLHLNTERTFLLLISLLGVLGWARPARLIRGVVLSARKRDYVTAAKSFGASDFYILRRHILPEASGVALTQFAIYIPRYALAEVTLSFFGLGISQPYPSWGNMLIALQSYFVLQFCWWLFAPAAVLMVLFFAYNQIFLHYSTSNSRI